MLVAGIIVTIVAVLMMIFPEIFILLKNPKISRTSLKSKKVKNAFRILRDHPKLCVNLRCGVE